MFNQKIMFNQNCNCSSKTISVPEPNMQQTRVSQDIHALATSYMHWLHHTCTGYITAKAVASIIKAHC